MRVEKRVGPAWGWLARTVPLAAILLAGSIQPTFGYASGQTIQERIKAALASRGVPLTFSDPIAGPAAIALAGYVPSHGWVGFKGEGVAYGRPPSDGPFVLTDPPVLLYRPIPSGAYSDAQLSDQAPEAGYELVGVAYFKNYEGTTPIEQTPPESPPTLDPIPNGLLPAGAWFRHTGGCHLSSGEFVAFSENLPDPALPAVQRLAMGVSWCQGIGINSVWAADGDIELGASGRCLLDRDLNPAVGLPRPVRPNSFARMNAPSSTLLPRPSDPPSPPTPVADPGPPPPWGTATPVQIAQFGAYQSALTTYNTAVQALNAWRTSVASAATADCQTIGAHVSLPNAPTFWHGAAWDTHLFFNDDLSSHAGVNDFSLVPNGYTGPPFSFAPGDATLLPVAFPPAPQVSAGGPYTVSLGSPITLTATIPGSVAGITFGWDLTHDGKFPTLGQTTSFTPSGPGDLTVTAQACDTHGACTTSDAVIHVRVVSTTTNGGLATTGGVATTGDPGSPPGGATPELDSLLLFGAGLSGLGGYALTRWRAHRRR